MSDECFHAFLPWYAQTYRKSAAAELCKALYDVPKPPRPVIQPLSPPPEDAPPAWPHPPPVNPSEGEAQQRFGDYKC